MSVEFDFNFTYLIWHTVKFSVFNSCRCPFSISLISFFCCYSVLLCFWHHSCLLRPRTWYLKPLKWQFACLIILFSFLLWLFSPKKDFLQAKPEDQINELMIVTYKAADIIAPVNLENCLNVNSLIDISAHILIVFFVTLFSTWVSAEF